MCACTEGSRCGQVTIELEEQAQSAELEILYLKHLLSRSRSLRLSLSLSLARALSLSVSVPLAMCTYANIYLGHLTLEQEAFQLPQTQGAQIFRNLHARRRRRSEDRVSWPSVPSL